jgi:hypothetical protein
LHTMLEVRDEKNTSLSFGCLITQICVQVVTDISDYEPRSRIPDPLGFQTLMKPMRSCGMRLKAIFLSLHQFPHQQLYHHYRLCLLHLI